MFKRKSIRLEGFDYSHVGYYFVTICVHHRMNLFGNIVNGQVVLNDAGHMVKSVWDELPMHYPIEIDAFVVMPNHIHGIIYIVGATPRGCPIIKGQAQGPAPTISLSDIVHRFKSFSAHKYQYNVLNNGWMAFHGKLWQRNYYDHIIRHEKELSNIRQYILNNPAQWETDINNVETQNFASLQEFDNPNHLC